MVKAEVLSNRLREGMSIERQKFDRGGAAADRDRIFRRNGAQFPTVDVDSCGPVSNDVQGDNRIRGKNYRSRQEAVRSDGSEDQRLKAGVHNRAAG